MDYLPAALLLALAVLFVGGALLASAVIGGRRRAHTRLSPYESGVDLFDSPRKSFPIKFYLIAILFILFDLEVVYLYPWAALYKKLKIFGLIEMGVFIAILVVGYLYAWKRGAFEWE